MIYLAIGQVIIFSVLLILVAVLFSKLLIQVDDKLIPNVIGLLICFILLFNLTLIITIGYNESKVVEGKCPEFELIRENIYKLKDK